MIRIPQVLPVARVPLLRPEGTHLSAREWSTVPALPPFVLADGGRSARQQTTARLCHDGAALHVRFDCEDRDIWGTLTRRDDPLYDEEAVEVFLAPGEEDPVRYFELEASPLGALFDARIENPSSRREDMRVDARWNCPGIAWRAEADPASRRWWAEIIVPWSSLSTETTPPSVWRANLCRIERPRGEEPEFSCWSPTLTDPADFHKPAYFGFLDLSR